MELELRLLALLPALSPHMGCLATCAVRSRPGQGGTSATDCSLFVLACPSSTPPDCFSCACWRPIRRNEKHKSMYYLHVLNQEIQSDIYNVRLYARLKYRKIHADMHLKNGAYMQVCSLQIHSNTCRYAPLLRCISDSIFMYVG